MLIKHRFLTKKTIVGIPLQVRLQKCKGILDNETNHDGEHTYDAPRFTKFGSGKSKNSLTVWRFFHKNLLVC